MLHSGTVQITTLNVQLRAAGPAWWIAAQAPKIELPNAVPMQN